MRLRLGRGKRSKLINYVRNGESIIIFDGNTAVARLEPIEKTQNSGDRLLYSCIKSEYQRSD